MTNVEIRRAKQDFSKFLLDTIKKYKPSDAEMYILYSEFISHLCIDLKTWGYEDKEKEEEKGLNI